MSSEWHKLLASRLAYQRILIALSYYNLALLDLGPKQKHL